MNPVIPWYTVATVMLNFVGSWRCSRALDQSAEAACWVEAGFQIIQTITQFNVIITSLLSVITIIMSLCLHIITCILTSLTRINILFILLL